MPFKLEGSSGVWGGAEELAEDPSLASFHFTPSSNIILDPSSGSAKRKSGQRKSASANPNPIPLSSHDGPQLTSSAKRRLRRKRAEERVPDVGAQDSPVAVPIKRSLPQDQAGKRRKAATTGQESEAEPGTRTDKRKGKQGTKMPGREQQPSSESVKKERRERTGNETATAQLQDDEKPKLKSKNGPKQAKEKQPTLASRPAFNKPAQISPSRPPPLPAKKQPSHSKQVPGNQAKPQNQSKTTEQPQKKLTTPAPQAPKAVVHSPQSSKASQFREKLQKKLGAAHFRSPNVIFLWLNEQMYTQSSGESVRLFRDDPSLFTAYHTGFQDQVSRWPANPVDLYIARLQSMDQNLVASDFGCGEAKLAQSVQQQVHSFDLVAVNDHVTVSDSSHVPLDRGSVDVAVFCLALMGSNYIESITEAHRVLRRKGLLWIAEVKKTHVQVKSRFGDEETVEAFVNSIEAIGFTLTASDTSNKMFVTFDFDKSQKGKPCDAPELRPCFYKRR